MTPEQVAAAVAYNDKEEADGDLTKEMKVRLLEYWQDGHQLGDDGWGGPLTQLSIQNSMVSDWKQPEPARHLDHEDQFVDGKWLNITGR